jgi:hypothetical protein
MFQIREMVFKGWIFPFALLKMKLQIEGIAFGLIKHFISKNIVNF